MAEEISETRRDSSSSETPILLGRWFGIGNEGVSLAGFF